MKIFIKLMAILFVLLSMKANASEDKFIVFAVDVYQLTSSDTQNTLGQQIANANEAQLSALLSKERIISQPRLIGEIGKQVSLSTATKESSSDVGQMNVVFSSTKGDSLYLVEFELHSGDSRKVTLMQATYNEPVLVAVELGTIGNVIKVSATTHSTLKAAQTHVAAL